MKKRKILNFIITVVFNSSLLCIIAFLVNWFLLTSHSQVLDKAGSVNTRVASSTLAVTEGNALSISNVSLDDVAPLSNRIGKRLVNEGYVSYYSESLGIPIWVGYVAFQPFKYDTVKRPSSFKTDYRVRNSPEHSDYTHSGYDRGHMAPNYVIGKCYGSKAQYETFYMTNIVPQSPNLNRKQWMYMEQYIANTLTSKYDAVLVFVGPVVGNSQKKLNSKVVVPDGFWSVVFVRVGDCILAHGFLIPQNPTKKNFMDYIVSVDRIEEVTGLDFLPKFSKTVQAQIESKVNRLN